MMRRRFRLPTLTPKRALLFAASLTTLLYILFPAHILSASSMPDLFENDLSPPPKITENGTLFTPPLRAKGRYIVDAKDERVKLRSANWYGASDVLFVPSGLDVQHRSDIAKRIRSMGFNSVRLPFSGQMARDDPLISTELVSKNPDLKGKTAIEVFKAVVDALTDEGLGVIINDHVTRASWCDGMALCDSAWENSWLGPFCKVRQTEDQWIERWKKVVLPLKDNPLVIGLDLRNEPRGLWGTMWWSKWARAAEKAAEVLLKVNSDWLIIVEGVGSANFLSSARNRPIQLSLPDRLVYSVHVFGWSGWGQFKSYTKTNYEEFSMAMRKNWAYLLEEDIAPVWVAEMGAGAEIYNGEDGGERNYWRNLMKFMGEVDADWGYWAINPRKPDGDSLETWRLLDDDWDTLVNDFRLLGLRSIMGQRDQARVGARDQNERLDGDLHTSA